MSEITERTIKFTSQPMEVVSDYAKQARLLFQGEGELVSVEDKSNADGTDRRTYKLKPLLVEFKENEGVVKQEISIPKTKSKAKELRDTLYIYWQQEWCVKYPDFEVYYQASMDKIIEGIREKLI